VQADDSGGFEANDTKREVRITMRDGVNLFTDVYTPKEPGSYVVEDQRFAARRPDHR